VERNVTLKWRKTSGKGDKMETKNPNKIQNYLLLMKKNEKRKM